MNIKYTPKMVTTIKQHLLTGKHYSEIAKLMTREYKISFTKNMIIGKMNRLKRKKLYTPIKVEKRKKITYDEFLDIIHS